MVESSGDVPVEVAELVIVEACSSDYEQVALLFGALHTYNAQLDPRFALADNWHELLRTHLEQTEHDHDCLWLLAYLGQQPVGLLLMEEHQDAPIFRYRRWAEVVALYVTGDVRGSGVAQSLMAYGYRWAASHGLACVQLYVTESNQAARLFYRKEGFVETQAIMRRMLHTEEREPAQEHHHHAARLHFSESGERPLDMHWMGHQDEKPG